MNPFQARFKRRSATLAALCRRTRGLKPTPTVGPSLRDSWPGSTTPPITDALREAKVLGGVHNPRWGWEENGDG